MILGCKYLNKWKMRPPTLPIIKHGIWYSMQHLHKVNNKDSQRMCQFAQT